jgi:dienelactone hydrolase
MRIVSLVFGLPVLLSAAQPMLRDVSLKTPDGFVLRGTLSVPAQAGPRPVVVLAHQFKADRTGWKPLTDLLAAQGIATLAMDLRGHGQSTLKDGKTLEITDDFMGSASTIGFDRIQDDIVQAAAWVRKQPRIDPRRVALAGSSVGAFAALLAARKVHPLAVVALSPAGNGAFGDNPKNRLVRAVESAHAAVMVMASGDDREAAANATLLKDEPGIYVRLVPGQAHGFALLPGEAATMAGWLAEYFTYHYPALAPAKPATGGA